MGLDTKRADSDLEIKIVAPSEELDALTTKAQDYSPAMEMEQRGQRMLAEVPKNFAGISSAVSDGNRNIEALNYNTDYNDTETGNAIALNKQATAASLSLANAQYDSRLQMSTAMENAKIKALQEGTSVSDAIAQAASPFKDTFNDSTKGQQQWGSFYNDALTQGVASGINIDFEVQQKKAQFNLSNLENTSIQDVAMGKTDIDSSFANLVKQGAALGKDLKNTEFVAGLSNNYNQMVVAKALFLGGTLDGTNGTQVAAAIKNLIATNGSKKFNMTDANGKVITKDGKPQTMQFTLTPETTKSLLDYAHSAEAKVSSAGSAGASAIIKDYADYVGKADIEKTGVSDYLMSADPMTAERDYKTAIQSVLGGDQTPKAKTKSIQGISDTYFDIIQPTVLANHAMQLTPTSGHNRQKLITRTADLKKRLNSGESMVGFSLNFDMEKGGSFTLKPELNAMNGFSPEITARNAWTQIYNTLEKTVKAPSNADFAFKTNAPYNANMGAAIDSAGRMSMVQTNNRGDSWTSKEGMAQLTDYLVKAKSSLRDTAGASSAYSSVPSNFVDSFVDNYLSSPNKKQQIDYVRGVATSLRKAGYADFVLSPKMGVSDKERPAINALMTEMYLSQPELSTARAALTNYAATGGERLSAQEANKYLQDHGIQVNQKATALIKQYNIPAPYQESFRETIKDVAVAYASGSLKDGNGKFSQDVFGKIARSNFIPVDSKYMKTSLYVGSPILQNKNIQSVTKAITEAGDATSSILKSAGIDTNKYPVTLTTNQQNGYIDVVVGGRKLAIAATEFTKNAHPIGVPFDAPKPSNVSEDQWNKTLARHVATGAVLTYAADPQYSKAMVSKLSDKWGPGASIGDAQHLQRDAVRILKQMQSDTFLSEYKNHIESGELKSGANPAPLYMKKLFETTRFDTADKSNEVNSQMLDYAYSRSTAFNKVSTVSNKPLSHALVNIPYSDILTATAKNGFVISRGYDPFNVPGVSKSLHGKGMALDYGIQSNKMLNPVTGRLDVHSMQSFTRMITSNPAYGQNVKSILTSRPELLENKPEYAAYAQFRKLRNAKGEPLFRDARQIDKGLMVRNSHANHFHVSFNHAVVGPGKGAGTGLVVAGYKTLANDMVAHQTDVYGHLDNRTASALVGTFAGNYGLMSDANKTFGIANLNKMAYNDLGVSDHQLNDPVMQARVMANRYQAYSQALGNSDLAVFALAGGKFTSSEDHKSYRADEILSKGISANAQRSFTLAMAKKENGAPDAAEQVRLNSIYKKFKKAYKNEGAA